ncbi:putative mitochondrial carrier YMR166C [Vitis vinifera]|uniref:Putative mitochondrial carrier YMR166C n=1 Tax=Vitis vinifera TaxID=29760 RepID=A0A438DBM7_VITVI|nr:putative mitochondrial carrier YMR166C [Vitis vinifera]
MFMIDLYLVFAVWREFVWGAMAGAFGEGMMHPIDTVKTRIQSQAILRGGQNQKTIIQMVHTIWAADGLRGFYRGITPGLTGSLATGATYFGVIESTKKWIEESHPSLEGHWAHFIAGSVVCKSLKLVKSLVCCYNMGDTLGSFVYVPCEVMKQRMQVQGTKTTWSSVIINGTARTRPGPQMYGYYAGMFQAGCSIWKEQGLKGLYAGYWSTLARDVPFSGLMVTSYEALKDLAEHGKQKWIPNSDYNVNSSVEGLVLGGLAGDKIASAGIEFKDMDDRRCQRNVQREHSRIVWYIPASALTFMAVEFLRDHFNGGLNNNSMQEVSSLSIDKKGSSLQEVA